MSVHQGEDCLLRRIVGNSLLTDIMREMQIPPSIRIGRNMQKKWERPRLCAISDNMPETTFKYQPNGREFKQDLVKDGRIPQHVS
jgi:hypothetical protein